MDVFSEASALRARLGAIGTAEKAFIALYLAGFGVGCGPDATNGAWRQVPDGFELVALRTVSDCQPIVVERYLLQVDRDGRVELKNQEEASRSDSCI